MNKTHTGRWRVVLTIAALVWAAGAAAEPSDYEVALEAWKKDRLAYLKGADGYLNLVGLFWLRKPDSTFGSDGGNDLVFPAGSPALMGRFLRADDEVRLRVVAGVDVRFEGAPVADIVMRDDTTGNPVVVTHADLAWTVIRRDQQFAVRVRDFAHPAIQSFPGIRYFPADESFRVIGRLQPYDKPRQARVNTVVEGLEYKPQSPGTVAFELQGNRYELEAYATGSGLMFVFGDASTGRQTYPAGRFLYTAMPDADGRVVLDFNQAENPPCAFNEFATCPVASARNRIKANVTAGERYDRAQH